MPLLRRKPFVPKPLPENLNPDKDYFVCKATDEVFEIYEEFFERVIVCNSLVWTCSVTGRPGLTYAEAITCEKKALAIIDRWPQHLREPVLFLATLTHRTRINDLNEDVYTYVRDVYFKDEVIEAIHDDEWWEGKVVDSVLVSPEEDEEVEERAPDEPDWDHIRYKVRLWDDETNSYIEDDDIGLVTVDTSCIRREKNGLHSINQDKCKMFIKYHCEQVDMIWRVKQEYLDKYNLSDAKFSHYICLEEPKFTHSKAPSKSSSGKKSKSKRTDEEIEMINQAKQRVKEAKEAKLKEAKESKVKDKTVKKVAKEKMTAEQKAAARQALRDQQQKQREEAAAKLAEERAKLRELREQERLKVREEKKLIADKLREWNKPRDDLLCDDLAPFPTSIVVPPILAPHFGEIVMVVEFLTTFGEQLEIENTFPDGICLDIVEKALFESDINGPLSDLLCFLLTSIFNCIEEEEAEEQELEQSKSASEAAGSATTRMDDVEPGEMTYKELITNASSASQICQLNHGKALKEFQLDPLTVSEILRLHLLASGAKGSSASVKFRYQNRGGYTSLDDAGIELKKDHPNILNALATGSVFDLEIGDKVAILSTLINQLLSYASFRDIIDEAMDQHKSLSYELKQVQWAEQRREREEATLRHKKRLEQRLQQQQNAPVTDSATPADSTATVKPEKMETDQASAPPTTNGEVTSDPASTGAQNEEALKEARKTAKRIINDTAKLDPNRIPQDTGRSRRKNAPADDFNWREYDMTEWNNLEERYLPEEDIEILTTRRKEIETRKKQDFLDREAEMYDQVTELGNTVGIHSMGHDRWGRSYWSFNSLPGVFIERIDGDTITQPTDLDSSIHSEKENMPVKQEAKPPGLESNSSTSISTSNTDTTSTSENMDSKTQRPNTTLDKDPSHAEESTWVYYNTNEQYEELLNTMNNRGYRESALKQKLMTRRRRVQQLNEKNPEFVLDEHSIHEASNPVAVANANIKSRSRIAKGLVQNTSAQESLELNLREMLLDLEERICVGGLGNLKISNRGAWREALECGSYAAQDKELSLLTINDVTDENDTDALVVKDLLRALLQIQRAVEPKYLCKPLGFAEVEKKRPGPKKAKKEEVTPEVEEGDGESAPVVKTVDRWRDSLLSSSSLSQIFLHMCTVESSILWSKSSLNARCRLCRRKGDGDKMLLCDMCDRGHHMYCLKPPVKDVPRGDWFCPECRPKQTKSRRASTRRKSFYEEETEEEPEEVEEEEAETDDSVYDEDTASSSEEEPKHPKIKLLKASAKGAGSGRSSPASTASGKETKSRRSRTSTPEVEAGRFRRSAAPSPEAVPSRRSKGASSVPNTPKDGSSSRRSRGSRASSPADKYRDARNSLGSARSNLSEEVAQLAQCEEIVRDMMEMDDCWPFLTPVNKREVPDYYTIIKRPMDCQTILSNAKMVKYTNVRDMIADVRQMFKNCVIYNEDGSDIFKMGEKISKYFEKHVRNLKLDVNPAKRPRRN